MADQENERVADQWHLEMVQDGKVELAETILASDVVIHVGPQELRGHEGATGVAQAFKIAFPDVSISHHEALASGDQVAIRWSATGTHGGDYFGIPACNKWVSFVGIDWFHFRRGKIAELWIEYDNLGLTQQMQEMSS